MSLTELVDDPETLIAWETVGTQEDPQTQFNPAGLLLLSSSVEVLSLQPTVNQNARPAALD